jgi:hypothetical protein
VAPPRDGLDLRQLVVVEKDLQPLCHKQEPI